MFFIPGVIISVITFPGVMVHELAHQLFCRLFGLAVFEVKYFGVENPAGYVIHEPPKSILQNVVISTGPFLVNTLIGSLIACPAAISLLKFKSSSQGPMILIEYVLLWLGVSVAMHAFPSTGDAKSIWEELKRKETPIFYKIIITPIVGIIYLGAAGSMFWLDIIYGIAVAALIPNILIRIFT